MLFIAFMPGLFFMWKAFSPDYFSAFSFLMAIYLVVYFIQHKEKKSKFLYLAMIFLGISLSLKLYNIFLFASFAPFGLYYIIKKDELRLKMYFRQAFLCCLSIVVGLIIGNLRLLSTPFEYLALLKMHSSLSITLIMSMLYQIVKTS